jgi:exopolysaccharide production protein ExoQ
MSPSLASLVYVLGICGLFYLNRDKSVRTSRALWIPVIWFWILGSRAVSVWLNGPTATSSAALMDGSPIDALFFLSLLASGIGVLVSRGKRSLSLMSANWPVVWYFSYCLLSVAWSDFPDVSIKRWMKATGDVVMALVVVTDAEPIDALRRLFSRVGFVLLPASALLIKYYPYLGRGYNRWTGEQFNNGVTTDKNILGVTAYILAVGAFWQALRLWRDPKIPNRLRRLIAQGAVCGFGIWVLFTANSATSESCFMLAAFLMLVTGWRSVRGRPAALNVLVLMLTLLGCLIKITGADAAVFHALGRNSNLSGRAADIWPLLIPMAPNVLLGAGFESFWLGPRLQKVWDTFPNLYVSEAHNGYLELYLNLGVIGVGLILWILVHGYRRSVEAFRIDPDSSALMVALVLTSAIYSYTEAGFRMLDFAWSFLLIAIIGAGSISQLRRESTYQKSRIPSFVNDPAWQVADQ